MVLNLSSFIISYEILIPAEHEMIKAALCGRLHWRFLRGDPVSSRITVNSKLIACIISVDTLIKITSILKINYSISELLGYGSKYQTNNFCLNSTVLSLTLTWLHLHHVKVLS